MKCEWIVHMFTSIGRHFVHSVFMTVGRIGNFITIKHLHLSIVIKTIDSIQFLNSFYTVANFIITANSQANLSTGQFHKDFANLFLATFDIAIEQLVNCIKLINPHSKPYPNQLTRKIDRLVSRVR